MNDVKIYKKMSDSFIFFLKEVWGISMAPVLPKYAEEFSNGLLLKGKDWDAFCAKVRPDWFAPYSTDCLTWQQTLIAYGIVKAMRGEVPLRISVVSGHGTGKAHPLGMEIDTPTGRRLWGSLRPGDMLFSETGAPVRIIATSHYSDIPMYRVTFDDRSWCDVSSGHLWNVRGRNSRRKKTMEWDTVETIDLVGKEKRANGISMARQWEVPVQGAANFPRVSVPVHPYMLGVWLGDGARNSSTITSNDHEVTDRLAEIGEKVTKRKSNYAWNVSRLSIRLKSLGILDRYSYEKEIPSAYLYNDIETRSEVLRGLLDTDGEVGSNGTAGFSSTSRKLADHVIWLARSLGGKAMIQPTVKRPFFNGPDGKKKEGLPCYRVTINMPKGFRCFYISRKQERLSADTEGRYLTRWIDSIEPIVSADGMCVTVASDSGLYLANDFIVTHNSAISSLIILWFLFAHPDCQVACTSPGQQQLFDILWKEIKKWIERMPSGMQDLYQWESAHIRMKESPNVWFARAKTASKENTEALAGVHADWVLIVVDEASGVDEAIYETMEGSLTSGNILVFLVSNGTRANGYFFDTHHKDSSRWQNYALNSLDSPRVDAKYVQGIVDKYGIDSVQYAIRVQGQFPKEDGMDDSGYVPLILPRDIRTQPDYGHSMKFGSNAVLGVDPAGDGDDKTSWVIRDNFKAKKLYEEAKSTPKGIAERTLTFMALYDIAPKNVVIDSFGVGADVGKEIAIATKGRVSVTTVNTGDKCDNERDADAYLNKRAMCYYEAKKWMQQGGEIVENGNFAEELSGIRYKRNLAGLIQIMPKLDMRRKYGLKSPNDADAFSLTFLRRIPAAGDSYMQRLQDDADNADFDPFAVI